MQLFTITNVMTDQVSQEAGYWYHEVKGRRGRRYNISITRDDKAIYTVSCYELKKRNVGYIGTQVHIGGHVSTLSEAIEIANELVENVSKHDLFVSLRNGVGTRVTVRR